MNSGSNIFASENQWGTIGMKHLWMLAIGPFLMQALAGNCMANGDKGDAYRTVREQLLPAFTKIGKTVGKTLYASPENVAAINRDKFTIGYSSLAEAKDQPHITLLQFGNVSPEGEDVISGTYKLVAPLGLVWKDEPNQAVRNSIDFFTARQRKRAWPTMVPFQPYRHNGNMPDYFSRKQHIQRSSADPADSLVPTTVPQAS